MKQNNIPTADFSVFSIRTRGEGIRKGAELPGVDFETFL